MSTLGAPGSAAEVYARLGVRRVINAADTYTDLGGARFPDEVAAAVAGGASHQVDLLELMERAGRRVAELTRNPAALFVAGAGAGVAVTVAAAIAGTSRELPMTAAEAGAARNDIVVLCCQRNPYDRIVEATGGTLEQVGHSDSTPIGELRQAVESGTARAILWFAGAQFERYSPPLEQVAEIAKTAGVPLIVDAAAQYPPFSNLWTYRERGADMVIFSGGKGLKGPQTSGLVLGTEDWIAACARNAFPQHAIGRPMKTGKENIVGLLAAVERAAVIDEDEQYAHWSSQLDEALARLRDVPGLTTWIEPAGRQGQACPRLFLRTAADARTATEVAATLAAGSPSIRIGTGEGGERTAFLNPMSLLPGELEIVTDELVRVLHEEQR